MEEKIRYKIPKPTTETNKRTGQKGYKIYNFTWYENGKRKVSDGQHDRVGIAPPS